MVAVLVLEVVVGISVVEEVFLVDMEGNIVVVVYVLVIVEVVVGI